MALIDTVAKDVHNFLQENKNRPFMNERDLQMHLAIALKNSGNNYDKVEVEYYVPLKALGKPYVWNNEMKVDIVVKKDDEFIPIELKYKTKAIGKAKTAKTKKSKAKNAKKDIERFGEVLKNVVIIKDQSAQNLAKYDFWKDVRRIELLEKRFKAVTGGLVLFMTNDPSYQREPKEHSLSYTDSIEGGEHGPVRKALSDERIQFRLRQNYTIEWSADLDKNNPNQFEYILLKA